MTIEERLKKIEMLSGTAPQAEDNKLGLMYSLFCYKCLGESKSENPAYPAVNRAIVVMKGNSLCLKHYQYLS